MVEETQRNIEAKAARRSRIVSIVHIEPEDFTRKSMGDELVTMLDSQEAAEDLEQLAEESDFMIEYNFEEVEVAAGVKVEEIEEEELMGEEGTRVSKLAVPMKRFWMIIVGVVISTFVLGLLLVELMKGGTETSDAIDKWERGEDMIAFVPHIRNAAGLVIEQVRRLRQ